MTENTFLSDYIAIGSDTIDDAEAVFKLTIIYLDELKSKEYNSEKATLVEGLFHKMITISTNFGVDESFINSIEKDVNTFISVLNNKPKNLENIIHYYNKIYSNTLKFLNILNTSELKNNQELGPFKPDKSDKQRVANILIDVVEIIKSSKILSEKAKKSLTNKILEVINELHKEKSNWNKYFTNMGFAITTITTLCAIVSGVESLNNLLETKEKLQEANQIFENTSISISNKDLKEVFVIDESKFLENSRYLNIIEHGKLIDSNNTLNYTDQSKLGLPHNEDK